MDQPNARVATEIAKTEEDKVVSTTEITTTEIPGAVIAKNEAGEAISGTEVSAESVKDSVETTEEEKLKSMTAKERIKAAHISWMKTHYPDYKSDIAAREERVADGNATSISPHGADEIEVAGYEQRIVITFDDSPEAATSDRNKGKKTKKNKK